MRVKELYSKTKGLGLATLSATASWETFAYLNNYLFPVREKAYESLGINGKTFFDFLYNVKDLSVNSVPALTYFELGRATFQGSLGLMGNEFVKMFYETKLDRITKKIFGEKDSFRQIILSTALGGAVIELARNALAYKYILVDKIDPNYVFNYLIEPRAAIPEEIGRSVIYSLAFLYLVRDRLKR